MSNTMNLADIIRAYHGNLSRKQLKVARARLRRAGVTGYTTEITGPYTVSVVADTSTDARADYGTVVAQVAAMAWRRE